MSKNATAPTHRAVTLAIVLWGLGFPAYAQTADWRRVGNAVVERGLAGLTSGPIDRVWHSADGTTLYVRTSAGSAFETTDFERWTPSPATAPVAAFDEGLKVPESSAVARRVPGSAGRVYAGGRFAYRSDDGGAHWENLTAFRSQSIVGGGIADFSVHPSNPEELAVVTAQGVFRSMDGGKSWAGLNQGLPNLPGLRLRQLPTGERGVRVELSDAAVAEWQPGERTAWQVTDNAEVVAERTLRQVLAPQLGSPIAAITASTDLVYAGTADGVLAVAAGGVPGRWTRFTVPGPVSRIWVDAEDSRFALAAIGGERGRIFRTLNGGIFWDDLTANLEARVYSVTADRAGGALYAATSGGVFATRTNLFALAPATAWTRIGELPEAAALDVRLNASGTQLWALVEGHGVFSTLAPHRQADPRVVSAADFALRAAAPGALMSISGARVNAARAGGLSIPVLAAGDQESQIQIPFEAAGDTLAISIDSAGVARQLNSVALRNSAPAIFVDRDGSPMLLDGETGLMLDAMHPARSRGRLQILATGLGAVTPRWPTGLAAPLENPPRVAALVRVWLDRTPVEVTRAVLAPGYVGLYLIEVDVPAIVNFGPAELYIETAGQASNKVRVFIEP